MISDISITNYKSLRYQKFAVARVNVFFGGDGSGKTNLLEAVGMAAAAHDDASDVANLLKRGVRCVEPRMMFHAPDGKAEAEEIEIIWHERNSSKKAKLVCENPEDPGASWKDISWFEPAYIAKVNELISFISNGSIEDQYPFADQTKNTVLNAAFRGSRNFRDYVIFNALTENKILELFADNTPPAFFAIDNIETLLAPDNFSSVINAISPMAEKHNKQVLITTNQPAIIRGMNLNDPVLKLFLLERTEEGQTIVKELTDKTLIEK